MVETKSGRVLKIGMIYMLCFFLTLTLFFTGSYVFSRDRIARGMYINGSYVGGMRQDEAIHELDNKFNERIKNSIISIKFKDRVWIISYKEIDGRFNIEKAVAEAYRISRGRGFWERGLIELGIRKMEVDIKLEFVYDVSGVLKSISKIQKEVEKKPIDAKISFDGGKFKVVPDVPGIEVDEEKLMYVIKESLGDGSTNINLPVNTVRAVKDEKMLKAINTKISSYYTYFSPSTDRASNIAIGTRSVDGKLVMPGEVFSLDSALGPRTEEYGYKEAPVIIKGELVDGIGGGVCQIASTLYNAALLADLDIVERRNHILAPAYIGLGRDAAISEGHIDLKFKNNRSFPIYIRGYIYGSKLNFEIYGDSTTSAMRVDIVNDVVEVIKPNKPRIIEDPDAPAGTEKIRVKPRDGYRVKTYRRTYINGRLVRDDKLSDDYYRAVDGEIVIGTKKL